MPVADDSGSDWDSLEASAASVSTKQPAKSDSSPTRRIVEGSPKYVENDPPFDFRTQAPPTNGHPRAGDIVRPGKARKGDAYEPANERKNSPEPQSEHTVRTYDEELENKGEGPANKGRAKAVGEMNKGYLEEVDVLSGDEEKLAVQFMKKSYGRTKSEDDKELATALPEQSNDVLPTVFPVFPEEVPSKLVRDVNSFVGYCCSLISIPMQIAAIFLLHSLRFTFRHIVRVLLVDTTSQVVEQLLQPFLNAIIVPFFGLITEAILALTNILHNLFAPFIKVIGAFRLVHIELKSCSEPKHSRFKCTDEPV